MKKSFVFIISTAIVGMLLSGCAVGAISKPEANVKMTRSLMLEPVSKNEKSVFINAKNSSGENINLAEKLAAELKAKGYTISNSHKKATFVLSTNISSFTQKELNEKVNDYGISSAARTEATSAARTASGGKGSIGNVAGNMADSLIGNLFDNFSKSSVYEVQTEIHIKQKINKKTKEYQTRSIGVVKGASSPEQSISMLEDKIVQQIVGIF